MLNKLLVALMASAFALGAYAQAPKSDAKGDGKAKAEAKKDEKAKGDTKKADPKAKSKADTKKDEKAKK